LAKIGFPDAPTNVSLYEIPIHLKIKADTYRLIGIISYDSYAEQEMEHYIAYCYRVINIWEEYDSLKNKCVTVMSHKLVRPSVIAYVKLSYELNSTRIYFIISKNMYVLYISLILL